MQKSAQFKSNCFSFDKLYIDQLNCLKIVNFNLKVRRWWSVTCVTIPQNWNYLSFVMKKLLFSIFLFQIAHRHVQAILFDQRQVDKIKRRDASVFENYEILDSQAKYILEWVVDWEKSRIQFNVTVKTRGYVGFGLSSKGLMRGSDIVIGGVLAGAGGAAYFTDRYGVDHEEPFVDKSQDWQLHEAWENASHTFLSFSRTFKTCDQDDYQINEYDMTNVIWAYGQTDNPVEYHKTQNRGSYPVYLLDPNVVPRSMKLESFRKGGPTAKSLAKEKLRLWTVSTRYRMRRETAYVCTMHKGPRLGRKHHIVGYHVRSDSQELLPSHLLLYRCAPPVGIDPVQFFDNYLNAPGETCYFLSRPTGNIPTQYCTQITGAQAIGGRIMFFPDHLGLPFGYSPEEYYLLQIHYDNPNGRRDIDSVVHFDLYYTSQLRPNELSLLTIGHHIPGSPSILIPPSTSSHHIYGHCGEKCTTAMLPSEGIKIFMQVQHTHYSGRRVRIHHIRGKVELPWIAEDNNYDGSFQAFRLLRNEVNVKPGDHLMIRCDFDNTWINGSVVGGFSSKNEMCLSYLFYYNRLEDYSLCRSEISSNYYNKRYLGVNNITWDGFKLDYVATSPQGLVGLSMEEIANSRVNWSPSLRRELQQDHIDLPQINVCSRSPFSSTGQGRVQGVSSTLVGKEHSNLVTIPSGITEYVPIKGECI